MKRFVDAREAVVPIPPVVVPVDVDVVLAIVAVEDRVASCDKSSVPLLFEYSRSCIVFRIIMR